MPRSSTTSSRSHARRSGERVLDTLLVMTESKQTGMGFPTEYGGGGDIGASIAAFQTLAYSATCPCW